MWLLLSYVPGIWNSNYMIKLYETMQAELTHIVMEKERNKNHDKNTVIQGRLCV